MKDYVKERLTGKDAYLLVKAHLFSFLDVSEEIRQYLTLYCMNYTFNLVLFESGIDLLQFVWSRRKIIRLSFNKKSNHASN